MICAIGQDSHAFDIYDPQKPLILGGVSFEEELSMKANSDGDVLLHALTNAISGITGVNILGKISDELCINQNITDSKVYVKEALKYLGNRKICHVSFSVEAKKPHLAERIHDIRKSVSSLLGIDESMVTLTATSGEGLTSFGKGLGIQVLCIITCD